MRFRALLALLWLTALAVTTARADPPQAEARPGYIADHECAACHPRQAAAFEGSKHRHAMAPASPASVRADFADTRFDGPRQATRFTRQLARFMVRTEGADGRPADFEVSHTFGIHPLQQYLIPQPGGRLQALGVAWDTTRQRWFSLLADDPPPPGSPLHWTGRYQNWNLMCGECHTTAFRKGYDDTRDAYRTRWATDHVGCQACHGPGEAHAASATRGTGQPEPTPNRRLGTAHEQVDQCASCHARRTRLVEDAAPGAPLLDNYLPDTLRAELYFADGQQKDEVFEYGSYRQSRMYQAGVACSDCHEPHGGKLRASGNALCTQCHNASTNTRFKGLQAKDYDSPAHHFHSPGQAGSQCVDCHMPSTNYMVVHGRRDHAIRIPQPALSARLGSPDACRGCHTERSAEWATAAIEKHHGPRPPTGHYGDVLTAARQGQPGSARALAALIANPAQPAIVRASAIEALAALGAPPPATALSDPDPVVRAAAAISLAARPAPERLAGLAPLLDDPLRAVRISAARGLADLPDDALPPGRQPLRRQGLADFIAAQQAMGDMPAAQVNLALLHADTGDLARAQTHFRRAVAQDPVSNAPRLALARFLVATRQPAEARQQLRDGLTASAQPGELHLALGLLAGELGQWDEALAELRRATELMPGNTQARRNLDALLRRLGQPTR